GWLNDFGLNLGGSNAYGAGAYTLWSSIDNGTPPVGDQYSMTHPDGSDPTSIDFWLNSDALARGGTYSIFDPDSSVPSNSGLPDFDYSAFGNVFDVFDDGAEVARRVLVVAVEDWREFDVDFTDLFFAIEIYDREGNSQFPVPEPSTYGLIGAAFLMALVAARRMRRA
ncbi:MAG TPA: PEP-CTERM sorting domain-containing protein, partial [Opitutaceae bacterium]